MTVKQPLLYASKNIYYDERWMEKQERSFVKWLNFVLTPPEMYFDARKQKGQFWSSRRQPVLKLLSVSCMLSLQS